MLTLIKKFNDLCIEGMPTLTKLYGHKGDKCNVECLMPNGLKAKIFDDSKMYYIAELSKENSENTFLLVTDKIQLAVIECSKSENKLLIWKRI